MTKRTIIHTTEKEHGTDRNMEEIEEIINSDADAETKCNMIYNILTAKPRYFKLPQWMEERKTYKSKSNKEKTKECYEKSKK